MKVLKIILGALLCAAIAGAAWVVFFHADWIKPDPKPKEKEPETDVAVRTVKITRATLHGYVDCIGLVAPEQRRAGGNPQPASAKVASSIAGVLSAAECVSGQRVEKGATLFQLDDRAARAEEAKAEAAIASAQATLARLKASTRPEQIAVSEIALKKSRDAVTFAELNDARLKAMAKDQLASTKQLEESAQALVAAREDQRTAEKQLDLLKRTPAPEELAEAAAKITESEKSLAAAQLQRSMLTIKAPTSGTVLKVNANPGEPVDTTSVLAEIMDLKRLETAAVVPAAELNRLKIGQPVEIGDGETAIKTTLSGISLQVDPKTDSITVYAHLPDNAGLRPGQSARMKITVAQHDNCLAVPEECVFRDKTDLTVIATVENGISSMQNVTPGLSENGLVEISGKEIKEGDTVVLAGAYGIDKDTKVHDAGSAAAEKK